MHTRLAQVYEQIYNGDVYIIKISITLSAGQAHFYGLFVIRSMDRINIFEIFQLPPLKRSVT